MIVLSIIIIIHINIISIYSLLHVLSNVVGYHTDTIRWIVEELFLLYLSFFFSLHVSRRKYDSPRFQGKKNDLVGFLPVNYLLCYTVYIHNVYKHMSNIYIIHIYFRPSHISSRVFFFLFLSLSFSLFIYPYLSPIFLSYFFPRI